MLDIFWALNDKQCVGASFIDLEKTQRAILQTHKKQFPEHLIKIILSMVHGKKLYICDRALTSCKAYPVVNGLQQDTVNSSILFNKYTCDLLNTVVLNNHLDKKAIAFADDLLTYSNDTKVPAVPQSLQDNSF